MESVTGSHDRPPGNQGQPPSPLRSDSSRSKAARTSFSARVESKSRPIRARASRSSTASRTHGVSARSVFTRSAFFSSGLARASVPFHCSKIFAIRGSAVATWRA